MQPQPKGVIGNIVPWNFPFDLSVGPLDRDARRRQSGRDQAVGVHARLRESCLREMVHATFDRDRVDVVVGGLELARAFTRVRWDHLLYTGSPAIGREIAKAAAEQLVPVTLELGGKCPAILAADSVDAESVKQVLATKTIKNGQMCISVDYCLVPRAQLEDFAALAADYARESMSGYCESESCTGIISGRHLERIEGLLEDARARGCDVRPLEEAGDHDPATRQLPISLVIDPPDDLALMQEEIFGPILPIKAYDTLDEAIDYVNAGERPLALYVFAKDGAVADEVLRRTTSGGACVNSAAVHGALPSLPFGGIGQSGSGRHHGIEGFREFSNLRGGVRPRRGRPDRGVRTPIRADGTGGRRRGLRRRGLGSSGRPTAALARRPYSYEAWARSSLSSWRCWTSDCSWPLTSVGDALEIPFAEGDQAHRGGCDDVGRALAAGEHPHLPEDVARPQRPDHLAALDHVGGAVLDDDQVVRVVALVHEPLAGGDRRLAREHADRVESLIGQRREQRNGLQAIGIHDLSDFRDSGGRRPWQC